MTQALLRWNMVPPQTIIYYSPRYQISPFDLRVPKPDALSGSGGVPSDSLAHWREGRPPQISVGQYAVSQDDWTAKAAAKFGRSLPQGNDLPGTVWRRGGDLSGRRGIAAPRLRPSRTLNFHAPGSAAGPAVGSIHAIGAIHDRIAQRETDTRAQLLIAQWSIESDKEVWIGNPRHHDTC